MKFKFPRQIFQKSCAQISWKFKFKFPRQIFQKSCAQISWKFKFKFPRQIFQKSRAQISWKFFGWKTSFSVRMDRQTDRLADTQTNLTFRGPCIVIYSYNRSQRGALFLKFIFYYKNRTHMYWNSVKAPKNR